MNHRQVLNGFPCQNLALLLYRLEDLSTKKAREGFWSPFVQKAEKSLQSPTFQGLLEAIEARQKSILAAYSAAGWATPPTRGKVAWRLAVGLSSGKRSDAMAFALHPLYGVPYLPASAIKGAVAHYSIEKGAPQALRKRIFGSEPERETARGEVIFLDAFPQPGAKPYLRADIINVHYQDYYTGKIPKPPADYWDPVPNGFMTIAKGVRFEFRVASRDGELAGQARSLLAECLQNYGVGAKTRGGYGYFDVEEAKP
jgi:CRISPR-associated protein Cmr6